MEWETPEDEAKAKELINHATTTKDAKQQALNSLSNVANPKKWQKEKMSGLKQEIAYLDEGIANLTEMGDTKEQTYHFKELSNGEGGVRKRSDGVMDIEHTNSAMAWHESVHIGDYKKDPTLWGFTKDGFLGTTDPALFSKSEIKAYRSQYSFDNKSLMYTNGAFVSKLSDVRFWVEFHGYGQIKR
jgi:hypothetical protein